MATSRRSHVEIPLRTDGRFKFIKGVTKHTTCGDVVKMVLKKDVIDRNDDKATSYGIFESSRGIERLLPGKSRLLKVMRTWGSATDYEFVLRKVNPVMSLPKVSEAKRRKLSKLWSRNSAGVSEKENNFDENIMNKRSTMSKNQLSLGEKNVHSACSVKEIYFSESDNTMHEFVSNGDKNHVTGVREYCDEVTSRQYNEILSVSSEINDISRNVTGKSDTLSPDLVDSRNVTMTSHVNEVKYAVRKTLKPKSLTTSTSSSTLSLGEIKQRTSGDGTALDHHDTFQSTPRRGKRSRSKSNRACAIKHRILAQTIKSQISQLNQKAGKEAILRKYFSDYLYYRSPVYNNARYRGQGDGAESSPGRSGARVSSSTSLGHPGDCVSTSTSLDQSGVCVLSSMGEGSHKRPYDLDYTEGQDYNDYVDTRVADGSEDSGNVTQNSTNNNATYVKHHTSAVSDVVDIVENDIDLDVTSDSGQEDGDFDVAFIDEITDKLEDSDDSETPCFQKLVDYSLTESDISEIERDGDGNVSYNGSAFDIVRNVFTDNSDELDEDAEMDSFMVTKLSDDISDEGLSSLGSDDEPEREFVV